MMKENENALILGIKKRKRRAHTIIAVLLIILLLLALSILMLGNTIYSPAVVLRVLTGETIKGATFAIQALRLPRMLAGILAGVSFGIAGNTFQTMLRNPLASPDVIGVTSGTSFAAVFCMLILGMSGSMVSVIAVAAGLIISAVIYLLSGRSNFSGGRLILIGIGVQAMINAATSYLLLQASQYDVPGTMRWLSGSLNGMQMADIPVLTIITFTGSFGILLLSRYLQALELGEATAVTLGVSTNKVRILLIIFAVLLIAFATAVTGPIAFVAFLSGPIATRLIGKGSATHCGAGLIGGIIVFSADLIGQFAFDTRFPVGVITGILGAPYLLYLLIKMNKQGGTV